MNTLYRYVVFCLFATVCIFSMANCQEVGRKQKNNLTHKLVKRVILQDSKQPLARVFGIKFLDSTRFLTVSNDIQLFENDTAVKTIGSLGKGSGQYNIVYSLTLANDTISVFDRSLSKLVYYSVNSGKLLKETILQDLAIPTQMTYQSGSFYALRANLSSDMDKSLPILFTLQDTGLKALNVSIKDLDTKWLFQRSLRVQSLENLKVKDNIVYFVVPMMPHLWLYNIQTRTMSSFPLSLHMPTNEEFMSADDRAKMSMIQKNVESISGVYLLDSTIALTTQQGADESSVFRVRLLSYSGKELGTIELSDRIIEVGNNFFKCLRLDMSGVNTQNPYSILTYSYMFTH